MCSNEAMIDWKPFYHMLWFLIYILFVSVNITHFLRLVTSHRHEDAHNIYESVHCAVVIVSKGRQRAPVSLNSSCWVVWFTHCQETLLEADRCLCLSRVCRSDIPTGSGSGGSGYIYRCRVSLTLIGSCCDYFSSRLLCSLIAYLIYLFAYRDCVGVYLFMLCSHAYQIWYILYFYTISKVFYSGSHCHP